MRLNELRPVPSDIRDFKRIDRSTNPKLSWQWPDYVTPILAKYGFRQLGSGSFASVYKHPAKDKVLKIFADDTKYLEWIAFSKAHRGNKYVPVFKSNVFNLQSILMDTAPEIWRMRVYGIFLEPLVPAVDANYKDITAIIALTNNYSSYYIRGVKPTGSWFIQHEDLFQSYLDDPDFTPVVEFLHKNAAHNDISLNNIMLRGKQVVLTDPLAT